MQTLQGFSWSPVAVSEDESWQAYWMKVDSGASSPVHEHPSTELLLIHEGVLHDDNGQAYSAGDVVVYAAGSRHFTFSPNGCIALVVTGSHAKVLTGQ